MNSSGHEDTIVNNRRGKYTTTCCSYPKMLTEYLQRIVVLNNLAEQLAKTGDYEGSTSTCRIALQAIKETSSLTTSSDIKDNLETLTTYLNETTKRVAARKANHHHSLSHTNTLNFHTINVSVCCTRISDYLASIVDNVDRNLHVITIDVGVDFEICSGSNLIDLICSILLYNLGIFHLLSANALLVANPTGRRNKIQASRQILALSLNIIEAERGQLEDKQRYGSSENDSTQYDVFQHALYLWLSCLMISSIMYASIELNDERTTCEYRTVLSNLKVAFHNLLRWTSKVYGSMIRCQAAAAA